MKRIVMWLDRQGNENSKLCNNEKELQDIYNFIDENGFYSVEYLVDKCSLASMFNKKLGGDSN